MFRPNRVGTPNIHNVAQVDTTATFTPNVGAITAGVVTGNIINALAGSDFNRDAINWSGSEGMAANSKLGLAQSFAVTKPLEGDTVGMELMGGLVLTCLPETLVVPFVGNVDAAPGTVLANFATSYQPTFLDLEPVASPQEAIATGPRPRFFKYRTQVIMNGINTSRTMVHGFIIYNTTSQNLTQFQMQASVRQLNDQQTIGYRDTLR